MHQGIHRSCQRMGMAASLICFALFSLLLFAEMDASQSGAVSLWYFAMAAVLSILIYFGFRLLGWVINGFLTPG